MPNRSRQTSRPPIVPLPKVGFVRPQSIRIVVVFPAPFAPRNPKISPAWIAIEILSAATFFPNFFERFLRTISDSDMEFRRDPYPLLIFCRSIAQTALSRQNFAVIPMRALQKAPCIPPPGKTGSHPARMHRVISRRHAVGFKRVWMQGVSEEHPAGAGRNERTTTRRGDRILRSAGEMREQAQHPKRSLVALPPRIDAG